MSEMSESAVAVRERPDAVGVPVLGVEGSRNGPLALRTLGRQSAAYANYGLEKVGGLGVVGAALSIVSAALFLSTIQPMREQIRLQVATISDASPTGTAGPTAAVAQDPLDGFLSSLPVYDDLPVVLGQVSSAAEESDLELESGNYELQRNTLGGQLERYQLAYPVIGTYPQIRTFIDSALVAVPTMALDELSLERDSVRNTRVSAEITFTVFLRGQP